MLNLLNTRMRESLIPKKLAVFVIMIRNSSELSVKIFIIFCLVFIYLEPCFKTFIG